MAVWQAVPGGCVAVPLRVFHAWCLGLTGFVAVNTRVYASVNKVPLSSRAGRTATTLLEMLLPALPVVQLVQYWLLGSLAHGLVSAVLQVILAVLVSTVFVIAGVGRPKLTWTAAAVARWLIPLGVSAAVAVSVTALVVSSAQSAGCPAHLAVSGASASPGQRFPDGFDGADGASRLADGSWLSLSFAVTGALALAGTAMLLMLRTIEVVSDRRRADAVASTESLQEALRVLSHETRGPTNSAVLALALLSDAVRRGRREEALELLRDLGCSLDRTKRGLDSLLALQAASAEAAASDVEWAWGAAHVEALSAARSAMRGAFASEGLDLELLYSEPGMDGLGSAASPSGLAPGFEVYLDSDKVAGICINFLSNGLKHVASTGGRIRLAVSVRMLHTEAEDADDVSGFESQGHTPRADTIDHQPASLAAAVRGRLGAPRRRGARISRTPRVDLTSRSAAESACDVIGARTEVEAASLMTRARVGFNRVFHELAEPVRQPLEASGSLGSVELGDGVEMHQPCASSAAGAAVSPAAGDAPSITAPSGLLDSTGSVRERGAMPRRSLSPSVASTGGPQPGGPVLRCVLVIEALDNGHGMSEDDLASGKLFAPFAKMRQGDGRLRMASTGLGLSIVKSMAVRDMGGVVGVSTKEGEGACFFAAVPCYGRRRVGTERQPRASVAADATISRTVSAHAAPSLPMLSRSYRRGKTAPSGPADSVVSGESSDALPPLLLPSRVGSPSAAAAPGEQRGAAASMAGAAPGGAQSVGTGRSGDVDATAQRRRALTLDDAAEPPAPRLAVRANGSLRSREDRASRRMLRRDRRRSTAVRASGGSTSSSLLGTTGSGGSAAIGLCRRRRHDLPPSPRPPADELGHGGEGAERRGGAGGGDGGAGRDIDVCRERLAGPRSDSDVCVRRHGARRGLSGGRGAGDKAPRSPPAVAGRGLSRLQHGPPGRSCGVGSGAGHGGRLAVCALRRGSQGHRGVGSLGCP